MKGPLIEARKLTRTYRQQEVPVHALLNVDLNVDVAEFVAVVGPSGSGKTTLLNLLGGLDSPTSGTVRLEGTLLSDMRPGQRADFRRDHIGFVFQSFNLIPVLSAAENVEYVMLLQGVGQAERQERTRTILREVGLAGMEDRRPYQMSGGQQQRVAIARAIVTRPRIIFADEPTANVDSVTGEALLDLMLKLNRELNMTFLLSTHDQMVMEHARRVIRLKDGQIESDAQRNV